MNAKIGFLIALILTAVIGVYGIELGIRVSTGSGGHPEYLAVVLIVIVLLLLVDLRFYRGYKRDKKKK